LIFLTTQRDDLVGSFLARILRHKLERGTASRSLLVSHGISVRRDIPLGVASLMIVWKLPWAGFPERDHGLYRRTSIRLGRGRSGNQSLPSRNNAFAKTIMCRMTARATLAMP
jgi:hypothetical protein